MRIVALDPGTTETGLVVWDRGLVECSMWGNGSLLARLRENNFGSADILAVEMIASYGMAVGREVFETCVWIGRFIERSPLEHRLVFRKDVKLHLCGSPRAKDPNVRAALIDKYGKPGTKKNQGPLYGISSHLWSALAVADYTLSNPSLLP